MMKKLSKVSDGFLGIGTDTLCQGVRTFFLHRDEQRFDCNARYLLVR